MLQAASFEDTVQCMIKTCDVR